MRQGGIWEIPSIAPLCLPKYFGRTLRGQGTMGKVFRGENRQTGLPVAIKRLKNEVMAEAPEMMELVTREGKALRRFNHSNIIKLPAPSKHDIISQR